MPESEDTEEARRQRSDDARRAALRERIERQKERERQIAADIANVDKKATKRIVFEDSDEEDGDEEEKGEKKTTSSSSKRPKLFDSEDEDEEEEDEEGLNEALINRHSGPKGEKLMQLESRFNADPRFKLDDKFAESDSDGEGNAELNAEKTEMKQEKDKNRELLSKILGKTVEEKKPKQTIDASGALLKARPFTRFDPENPEHLEWMRAFEAAKNPKAAAKLAEKEKKSEEDEEEGKEEENEEEEEDKDDEDFEKAEMFFKMDDQFATEMKERKETPSNGFSFLSMIGRKYEEKEEKEEEEDVEDEDQKAEKPSEKAKTAGVLLKTKPTVSGVFFVDPLKDEKIRSLAANFRRTQTVEKIIDKWAPHRDAIFKLYKRQRRDAMKKKKEALWTNSNRPRKRKIEEENDEKPAEND